MDFMVRKRRFLSLYRRGLLTGVVLCIVSLTAQGCSVRSENESLSMTGFFFDTVVQVEAWGTEQRVLDECESICRTYENMFSSTIPTSDISKINSAEGIPVTVSKETAELIQMGIDYGQLSDGMFDITIGPAEKLWDFHEEGEHSLPNPEELKAAVSHIDFHCIEIDGTTVTLSDPEAKIDLGGIAKGYIADQLKEYLQSEHVEHALINLGGNMVAVGNRYDGTDFHIGIQKPFEPEGTVMASLHISDKSVVTSGNYERYFEKDGVIYHHILDPKTGYPIQNNLQQVTIISDSSADGDALSTTCYALGLEKGMELIRSLEYVEAVFVTNDNEMILSDDSIGLIPAE